jgi:hypothetical protein
MKITKQELKQLIKEEVDFLLKEEEGYELSALSDPDFYKDAEENPYANVGYSIGSALADPSFYEDEYRNPYYDTTPPPPKSDSFLYWPKGTPADAMGDDDPFVKYLLGTLGLNLKGQTIKGPTSNVATDRLKAYDFESGEVEQNPYMDAIKDAVVSLMRKERKP